MRLEFQSAWAKLLSIAVLLLGISAARADQTEADVPGQMQIARWDVLLNDNATESVEAIDSKIIETKSQIYQAEIFNADALRAGINAASAAGGLEGGSQSMAHSQSYGNGMYFMQNLYFNYYQNAQTRVGMNGNGQGNETISATDAGHLHLKIDYNRISGQLYELTNGRRTPAPFDKKTSILYDGQLAPGEALAFSATIKAKSGASYKHMIVWEAFKAEQRDQQNFQVIQDSERWCQLGPKTIRQDADIALVWTSGATHPASTVSPKWEQKLEDGKLVRLTAVTRSDKWLYCWWDADGLPIASNDYVNFQKYYKDQPVWFSATVSGSADEWKKQTPTGHPSDNNNNAGQSGPFNTSIATVADQGGKATVGVPVGDWEQLGEIKKGGSIKVGNATYRLQNVQSMGDNGIFVQFYEERGGGVGGDLVTLSVVQQDGKEFDTSYLPMITAANNGIPTPQFQSVKLKDVKTFHVWRRKQQWVTFTGFATEPTKAPPDQVTAADLTAAASAQDKQQMAQGVEAAKEQLTSLKEKRKSWESIAADPTTPKGALRTMFAAAGKGDLKTVRARLKSSQSDSAPLLDAVARVITATASARQAAVARFGEENVLALSAGQENMGMPPLEDLEMQMMEETWTPRDDGGLQASDVALTKGDDGQFYLDLGQSKNNAGDQDLEAMLPTFVAMAMHAEQMSQTLKDNPTMTFDQFRQTVGATTPVPVVTQ